MNAAPEGGVLISGPHLGKGAECEAILRSLPEWFGIEQAIVDYRREVDALPSFVATDGEQAIGILALRLHNPYSAEITVMALRREWQRRGIGRAMLLTTQGHLSRQHVEYLQVKTLGPSRPDEHYERTRRFYLACGFRPLEETTAIWGAENPCLIMVKKVTRLNARRPSPDSCLLSPPPQYRGERTG